MGAASISSRAWRQKTATYWWLVVCVALFYSDVTAFLEQERTIRHQLQPSSVHHGHPRSHGTCDTLILLGSMHGIIDKFMRTGEGVGKAAIYRAYHRNGTISMELFYVRTLRSWVMGRLDDRIQIHLESDARDPQENIDGIYILTESTVHSGLTWKLDRDIHFQCETEGNPLRKRRAVGLIVLGITALVATITTTVFRGVAIQKGCLFYPSVCVMKEEITSLKPKAEELRSDLRIQMNEIGWTHLSSQLDKTKNYYLRLSYLLNRLKNNMTDISNYTKVSDTYSDTSLTSYTRWLADMSFTYVVGMLAPALEFIVLYNLLLSVVIKTSTAVLYAVGFVVGLGFSAYDVYTQVTEEKKVRDALKRQKTNIVHAINEMEKIKRQIEDFKSKYIKQIVKPLQVLVSCFQKEFPSFQKYLQKLNNPVNIKYLYTRHMNTHLQNLTTHIEKDLNRIERICKQNELFQKTRNALKKNIDEKLTIPQITTMIQNNYRNTSLPKEFNSTFALLQYMAVNLTTHVASCYWGIRMDLIRSGQLDKMNYTSIPLCRSTELEGDERTILTNVSNAIAPCRIIRQLRGDTFDSIYKLIKFIADFILPHKDCYWGYDLTYIRNTTQPVFESMKLHFETFLYINIAMKTKTVTHSVFKDMCKLYGVCEQRWQTFIYCSVRPIPGNDIHICAEESASDCRNMTSVYVRDTSCYKTVF